jgi:hypothetical protein
MTLGAAPSSIHPTPRRQLEFLFQHGVILSRSLKPKKQYVRTELGADYSAGYNSSRRYALVAESVWNWPFSPDKAWQPLRVALQTRIGNYRKLATRPLQGPQTQGGEPPGSIGGKHNRMLLEAGENEKHLRRLFIVSADARSSPVLRRRKWGDVVPCKKLSPVPQS